MRDVCNGVLWFVLLSGAFFAVASQVEDPVKKPQPRSVSGTLEGHPDECLACKSSGRMLPDELSNDTVWLKTTEADGLAGR